ncbi:MAG TPA: 6,7-dimethyl-8-ribityllumazine synthase [Alphaproteobacteria bacterium]
MTKVLIIEARYYTEINDMLLKGARKALDEAGVEHETLTVPGALEIPAAMKFADIAKGYDAYVVLGCVIRGETTHYDIVCNESARGVYDLVMSKNLAVGNGILTVESDEQALARADITRKNKGGEAARAALRMLAIKRKCGI